MADDYKIPQPMPVKTGKSPITPNQGGWQGSQKDNETKKGGS